MLKSLYIYCVRTNKRNIPILISLALLSLIGLQALWLFSVYQYKSRELKDKTYEALLETTLRLQREEDSKLILTSMDSLLVKDTLIHNKTKEGVQLIFSTIKNKILKGDSAQETLVEKNIRVINDSTTSTTVVRINDDAKKTVNIRTESYDIKGIKEKAGDLQKIFMKMALGIKDVGDIYKKIDFEHIQALLKEELANRGIDLQAEVIIMPTFKGRSRKSFIPLRTNDWNKAGLIASVPLFPNNFTDLNLSVNVGYTSKGNFVIKQMGGLLILSLIITLLVSFVMIYIFRRLLSQEKLHQLKTDFINNMTHELKTPIATISLAIDSINNPIVRSDDDKMSNYTAIIKEENKKLDQHVERVLQMALLEKGEMMLNKKNTDLIQVIQSAIKSNQLKTDFLKGTINFETSLERAIILGDEFGLLNVISNLVDNSLKYSEIPCLINIKITRDHENFIIEVKDNGIGMDKKELDHIFDKFYRVQRGNLHDVKGSGLGLSYVKSIVELHQGTIEVESEPRKGSTFIIKLKANANQDTVS